MDIKDGRDTRNDSALRNEMHELSRERSEVASYIAMQLNDRLNAMELYIKELINVLGSMEGEIRRNDEQALQRILESVPNEFIKWDLVNLVAEAKHDASRLGEYADAGVRSLLRPTDWH